MASAMVEGAAVQAAFGELLRTVLELRANPNILRSTFESLQSTLEKISPVIEQMEYQSDALDLPKGEIKNSIRKLEDCKKFIREILKVRKWNNQKKMLYKERLVAFDELLASLLSLGMQAVMASNQRESFDVTMRDLAPNHDEYANVTMGELVPNHDGYADVTMGILALNHDEYADVTMGDIPPDGHADVTMGLLAPNHDGYANVAMGVGDLQRRSTKVWKIVGFASSTVGLVCYGLSSSFRHLYGNWNILRITVYVVVSVVISCIMLFAENLQSWRYFRLKAVVVFLVLMLTSLYSVFYDKTVDGKPDISIVISNAAFSLMSLSLSRQINVGFEAGMSNFFLGCLTVELMKINWMLTSAAAVFCCLVIVVRSRLDSEAQPEVDPVYAHNHDPTDEV